MSNKPEEKVLYHVFTHEQDEWFENYNQAVNLYNDFALSGCARLYEERYVGDSLIDENCLESIGDFPW